MSAHVVLTALDPEIPATLSAKVCEALLRDELGYEGVLFSDDLEMKAVADARPVEENAVLSIAAGCDALLVCKSEELADRAHAAIVAEMEKSPAFRARAERAAQRVDALRWRAAELAQQPMPPSSDAVWESVLAELGAGS
jgi:beta-N-acetylhexosaminidase